VKTLDGTTYSYRVQATTTVQELKAMITKDTAVPSQLQRIIFRGKVLCLGVSDVRACPGAPSAAYLRPVCAARCSGTACQLQHCLAHSCLTATPGVANLACRF
jgi:hypothetical protein